jgi:twinkle protein
MNVDDLLSKLSYLKIAMGCDVVFLDHLSIVVSGMDEGNERICIDRAMTKLRSLVEQTGMALFVVCHLKKADGTSHEEGGRVSLSALRGSNSIAQLSDIVIGMERDQQSPDAKDLSLVKSLKSRFNGFTGELTKLRYNPDTGRQTEALWDEPEFTDEQEDIL